MNWKNLITVVSAIILVGTEILAVALASGWAIAGLFELGQTIAWVLMGSFSALGLYGIWRFAKAAFEVEPASSR